MAPARAFPQRAGARARDALSAGKKYPVSLKILNYLSAFCLNRVAVRCVRFSFLFGDLEYFTCRARHGQKRSRFITLFQAATKSLTNFFSASELA